MYKGKFASELSMNEVKEYYDELRQKCPCTDEQWADFRILKEKLIAFAYKILDGKTNGEQLQEPCDDCISRQAAIDEIEYELEMINSALDSMTLDFNARERLRQRRGEAREILNSIQQLPPVTTEPKIGWWIRVDKDKLKYSECEVVHFIAQYPQSAKINYCPNCGAKMQEVEG